MIRMTEVNYFNSNLFFPDTQLSSSKSHVWERPKTLKLSKEKRKIPELKYEGELVTELGGHIMTFMFDQNLRIVDPIFFICQVVNLKKHKISI